ncbi:hypothetical protein GPECTOR_85g357 [Gonium pectorale]|uniref:Sulfotransferase n=1 Tax=Gonium pectorale TaxID=33097 RepID=A0A150G1B2_GONPE|nr:hypothetical protein GPECTOR_85g357 [Gonium pectorale]|eukprot:KXZ43627.1 hypothetical protein GPECTOR_85g357 [Gonium pectorale]
MRTRDADADLPPYRYTLKHRWAVKLNFLSGITLRPWLTLLWRHWRFVDWSVYPHRVLFLSFMACLNSALSLLDTLLFSRAVAAQPLHPEPLFILGHPRTGTTHLHNLISRDPRFAFANTFHAGFPSSFLSLWPARWLLSGLLERTRPMDAMALDWDLPAEDEIAVNVLTGGDSPYLALVFPRLWRPQLRAYLTFDRAVFQSAAHMADTYYWYTYLQRPTNNDVNDFITDQYDIMYRSYVADRALVDPDRLVEVSFTDLDSDPLAVLRRIYAQFGLTAEAEAVIRRRWAPSFAEFGYE